MEFELAREKFGTWAGYFKPFIESEKFDKIFDKLRADSERGKIICPGSKDTFRAFKECDYNNLRCILMGMSPYHQVKNGVYVADGLMMSCSNTRVLQPSLRLFYECIENEVYNGLNVNKIEDPDLSYLAKQGVLLLNSTLTVEMGKPESHNDLWTEFMEFFFEDIINMYERGLPIVFLGKQAQRFSKLPVPFHHYVFETSHPASAAYKDEKWSSGDVFNKINKILEQNNGPEFKIKWLKEYE